MKFAYLIMAHDSPNLLLRLLQALDYKNCDIYLHIDKKSKEFSNVSFKNIVKNANLFVYSKFNVYWGDISQTKCQFYLLKQATQKHHDYYHLLSGHDVLIKKHSEIFSFFEKNKGTEFVHFESDDFCSKENAKFYHLFFYFINRVNNNRIKNKLKSYEKRFVAFQRRHNICRHIYSGANWFSITQRLAEDLLTNKRKVLRKIRFTICTDEYILQTFVRLISKNHYEFYSTKEDDYISIVRNIDWKRGTPYVWRKEDYQSLITSKMYFARKFDERIDSLIIDKLYEYITE